MTAEAGWCFRASQAIPAWQAILLSTLWRKRFRPVEVHSKVLNRKLWIRPRSSDWGVFMKVLGQLEYACTPKDRPSFIVDGGANIGLATSYFAWKYPGATIAAVEPEPSNLEILRRNCQSLPSVQIVPAALWSGHSKLYIQDSNSAEWAFSVGPEGNPGKPVETVTIGDLLRNSGFDYIDILKLDIEGAERELFREGWQEWLPRVRMIVIELHDRFLPGCSQAFYSAVLNRSFQQEIMGENVAIRFDPA